MDLFEYLLAMQKGGGGAKGSSAVYSGKDIVYDSVGQYAYVSTATFPKLKDNDIYFVTETYTSNGYTFKKGSIYVLTQGTGDEFDATLLNEEGITYEEIIDVAKGDLITMNVDGTDKQFRVLNMNDNVAEVVGMANASNSQQFAASGQIYAGSALDTYLNETFYATLNATAKAAIVDKTFTQDSWYSDNSGDPDYSGYYGAANPGTSAYAISLGSATFGAEITRHVYALSVQDVLDYVLDNSITDGQLQNYNVWKMFWNDEVRHTGNTNSLWLRSAHASSSFRAFDVYGDNGRVDYSTASNTYAVRPAFQIDLSKIPYTKV